MLEYLMKIFYIVFFLLLPSIAYSQSPCPGLDSINYSGQWYHTVQIGSQCWFKENLNIGRMIPAERNQINNGTDIEKFCYNNDSAMCDIYGGLYQWRETVQYSLKTKAKGICPLGWHIPSVADFDILISTVNNDGNALKQVGQGGGTNTSGFSALLGGRFDSYNLLFNSIGTEANYWDCCNISYSPTIYPVLRVENTSITNNSSVYHEMDYNYAEFGHSVRCLRDDPGLFLQSPFGKEKWEIGSVHKITWGGDLTDKKIKIEYSIDNGNSWIEIIDSKPAIDGEYDWTIPNTPSKSCKIRISDINIPANFSVNDSVFTIYINPCPPESTIEHGGRLYNTVSINGKCWFKENVNIGNMIPGIQESATNGTIEKYCYNDDTSNCNIYGGLYSYSETLEKGFCPTYWHLEGIDSLLKYVIYDANALKAVGQGSGFGAGTNTSGFSALLTGYRNNQDIFYGLGVMTYFPYGIFSLTHTNVAYYIFNNDNYFRWSDTWPVSFGSSYRCVRDDMGPLLLKSPVGGENWQIGTTQKITWALCDVTNIKIDYSTNNGTNWINIIASTPTSAGSYNWIIPNTPSTNCKVKISSVDNSDTNNISNVFSIYQIPINPCPGIPTVNYAGKTYNTIAIGDQCWLKENLNVGMKINAIQNDSDNGIIEKYCYNNDSNNCSIYGGLYRWNEAMQYITTEGAKGICPTGWHVPSWNELLSLNTFVSGNGNELKEVGQGTGTNVCGFSALLAGLRNTNGTFSLLTTAAFYWSSKGYDVTRSYYFELNGSDGTIVGGPINNNVGGSIRCINDSSVSALPVELITFNASINNSDVILNWATATEINCASFVVEKRIVNTNNWLKITSVVASGNSNSPKQYSFTDIKVNAGKYNYRLKIVDLDGTSKYSNIVNIEVAPPVNFELSNAFPNPWNPTTTFRYQVPLNILVTIKVFDALGREVSTLVNEVKPAGRYEITLSGKRFASGIYYFQMKAGNFIETKKITLLK
jgi:uncharacterized protein (TIGR02145 family)